MHELDLDEKVGLGVNNVEYSVLTARTRERIMVSVY